MSNIIKIMELININSEKALKYGTRPLNHLRIQRDERDTRS
jgi:hypothetical protein